MNNSNQYLEKKCLELEHEYNTGAALIALDIANEGKKLPECIKGSIWEGFKYTGRGLFLAGIYYAYPNIAPGSLYRYAYMYLMFIPPILFYRYIYTAKSIVSTYSQILKVKIEKLDIYMDTYSLKLAILFNENLDICSSSIDILTSHIAKTKKMKKHNKRAITARTVILNIIFWGNCLLHTIIYAFCILWMLDIK